MKRESSTRHRQTKNHVMESDYREPYATAPAVHGEWQGMLDDVWGEYMAEAGGVWRTSTRPMLNTLLLIRASV